MLASIVVFSVFAASACNALLNYDQGYPGRFSGFGDVNGDGKADFCRFTCPKPACVEKDVVFCCHLQGSQNQCSYSSPSGMEAGKSGKAAALIDANGDGRADFCRVLTPPQGGDPIPYCRIAGPTGWTDQEITFSYTNANEGKRRRL